MARPHARAAASATPSETLTVMLPAEHAAWIHAVGPYRPGVAYELPTAEARRLIAAKGFVAVGDAVSESPATDAAAAATTED